MVTDLKLKKTYKIKMEEPLTHNRYWEDIRGYKVVIRGFEEFDFFVHRRKIWLGDNEWRISEASSGFAFPDSTDGTTRQKAINNVTAFLSLKGKEKLANALKKAKEVT